MKYGIFDLIRKVHHNIPPGIRNYYKGINVFMRWIGYKFMPVRHYIFKDEENRGLFSFVYIGWDRELCYYWLNRFSGKYEIISENRIIASWSIPGFLKTHKNKIDLAIIESSEKAISGKYPDSFLLPRWMEMELDIESFLKKSAIKKIIKKIKKHSLSYEVREGIEAFDFFYHSMYKPNVLKRHGNSAQLADYNSFSRKFSCKEGSLFFLIKENEPVAAAFIEVKNGSYRLSISGVKNGNDEILKMGVVGALRYFIMLYYNEKGINKLLIGVSMPVVFDGVTEFKMRLGAEPHLKDLCARSKYYFIPTNAKPLTLKMLKSNPLFYIYGSELNIALFLDAEDYATKEEFFKFFNRLKTENVEMTRVFYFDNSEKITKWINEEGIANIEFIKYDKEIG